MSKGLFGNLTYWKFHVFNQKSDVTWHAPVPGRDHARHILQKMKIHEIHFEMVKIQIRNSVLFEMIKIQIGNRPQSRSRPGSRPWQGPVPYSDFDHFWDVKRVCVRICMFPMFVISLSFQALFALFSRSFRACRALAALAELLPRWNSDAQISLCKMNHEKHCYSMTHPEQKKSKSKEETRSRPGSDPGRQRVSSLDFDFSVFD